MNGNTELLNFIYQNSQMGLETINQLLDIANDIDFIRVLKTQLNEYRLINEAAKSLLNSNGYDEKGISGFEKMRTYLMINIQTLTNKSASHIGEMMIVGSTMGVIEAIKKIRLYKDANEDILNLMKRLLKIEEDNIKELKSFL